MLTLFIKSTFFGTRNFAKCIAYVARKRKRGMRREHNSLRRRFGPSFEFTKSLRCIVFSYRSYTLIERAQTVHTRTLTQASSTRNGALIRKHFYKSFNIAKGDTAIFDITRNIIGQKLHRVRLWVTFNSVLMGTQLILKSSQKL